MARFVTESLQTVQVMRPIALNSSMWTHRGYLFHQDGSGIITLRGIVNNPYANYTVYAVSFDGNIALAEGATVGPIAISLAQNGQEILSSRAVVTPAAVGDFFHVVASDYILVPRGLGFDISVINSSVSATPGAVGPAIDVQEKGKLNILRVA